MAGNYTVFTRSARTFEQMARARKITARKGLTIEEAHRMCANFNDNRTIAQVRRGTKMEFTS
jgi:hypothetical protein